MQYIHKKTGKHYWVIARRAVDCTNSRSGAVVVVYCRGDSRDVATQDWFVRDAAEFHEKFEPVVTCVIEAVQAGMLRGKHDQALGRFDDTPTAGMPSSLWPDYKRAYRNNNAHPYAD